MACILQLRVDGHGRDHQPACAAAFAALAAEPAESAAIAALTAAIAASALLAAAATRLAVVRVQLE